MCKLFKHEQQETHLDTKNEKTNTLSWIFKSAGSLKQQLGRYLVSLWNIILILNRPVFVLTP
jgi:phospholipase/lecithinase/hemolysin